MLIVNTMCKLLTAILTGFYANKKGFLRTDATKSLSSLIIRIASPCLIITSLSSVGDVDHQEIYLVLLIGFAIYTLTPLLSFAFSKLWRIPDGSSGTYQAMLIFSNCGFMAIPVCQSFFGDSSVFLLSMMNLPYNLLFYTYGKYLLSKDGNRGSSFHPQELINPGTIASLLAITMYFTGIRLPEFLSESVEFLGAVTTPLSMVCIGSSMADYSLKEVLHEKTLYWISICRLILYPAVTYLVLSAFIQDIRLVQIATIVMGMPVGSMVVMGAAEFQGNMKAASGGVALTTLLSIVTIPVMAVVMAIS